MISITLAKPTATVTIEPTGRRAAPPRDHSIKVLLKLSASQARYADKSHVATVARRALAAFAPTGGEADKRKVAEVAVTAKAGKTGSVTSTVIGVEGSAVWPARPDEDAIDNLRDALLGEGYRVAVREKRDCAEAGCKVDAMVDWNEEKQVPAGWHSSKVCGQHNYRTCAKCKSLYVLTSTNSVGPAPSVHCEVCGQVIIEWGSSKTWNAELVTRASIQH